MIRRALVAALAGLALAPAGAMACDRYAAAGGNASDANPGSVDAPFATVATLAASLAPGQTGCLSGTFTADQVIGEAGSPGARITLRPTPGASAKLPSLRIDDGGAHLVLEGVAVERTTPGIALRVLADDIVLRGLDVSHPQSNGSCVTVGGGADAARDVVLESSRVHSCGTSSPAIGLDHAIRAAIRDTYVYGTPGGRGIQMYEGPSGVTVERVVVAGTLEAVQFAGSADRTTTDAVVRDAVLAQDTGDIVAFNWDGPVGSGNRVERSCLSRDDVLEGPGWTLDRSSVVFAGPGFLNAAAGDFRMASSSPCRAFGPLPGAATGDALSVTTGSATVTGSATPRWQEATAFIEYAAPGEASIRSAPFALGAGALAVPVSIALNALRPGTTYDYRLVAVHTSSGAERAGETRSFTTAPAPDADGDGVPDAADRCPFAPRGAVDADGDGCADDRDRDGVPDAQDACVDVQAGAFDADRDGCPDDSDADGLPDQVDACDDEPAGRRDRDGDGCPDPFERLDVQRPSYLNQPYRIGGRIRGVRVLRLALEVERGATVRLRCRKGCAVDKRIRTRGRAIQLHRYLRGRGRMPHGARIELFVVKTDRIGTYFRLQLDRRTNGFKITQRCLRPGSLKPEAGTCRR